MQAELEQWCRRQLGAAGAEGCWEMVSGDASFRAYYRLRTPERSVIAVHAPPDKEANDAFVHVDGLLREAGLRAPAVLAWDRARGFLLLEDFGAQLLLPLLNDRNVDDKYRQALATVIAMQRIDPLASGLPPYDSARLRQEMRLFDQWFVPQLLGVTLDATERRQLERLQTLLVDNALRQPQVVVHRDFHSRNLMPLADGALGLIDFQDAVVGPITYDPVSLLRDCYIAWPQARVRDWALAFKAEAQAAQLLPACGDDVFLRWFDWMGLQRHLKVLGIFARLWLRDGKPGYLDDLPLVIAYTLHQAAAHEETRDFAAWFEQRLLPAARLQSWYREVRLA